MTIKASKTRTRRTNQNPELVEYRELWNQEHA